MHRHGHVVATSVRSDRVTGAADKAEMIPTPANNDLKGGGKGVIAHSHTMQTAKSHQSGSIEVGTTPGLAALPLHTSLIPDIPPASDTARASLAGRSDATGEAAAKTLRTYAVQQDATAKTAPPVEPKNLTDGARLFAPDDGRGLGGVFGMAERADTTLSTPATEAASRTGTAATVQMIGRQIAEAVPRNGQATLEITLHPEELGRVKLTLVSGENGPVLHVVADRPDTMDLIRRHIDHLTREFAAQGFAGLDVALGQDRRTREHARQEAEPERRTAPPTDSNSGSIQRSAVLPGAGLDIRV